MRTVPVDQNFGAGFVLQQRTLGVRDVLVRIKRAVLTGRYAFSEKASMEMEADGLTELDVAESILNAVAIYKVVRSASPFRGRPKERLYVIQSTNLNGLPIYTKGRFVREADGETYYFLESPLEGGKYNDQDYNLSVLQQ